MVHACIEYIKECKGANVYLSVCKYNGKQLYCTNIESISEKKSIIAKGVKCI